MYSICTVTQSVDVHDVRLQVREPVELAHDALLPKAIPITQQEYYEAQAAFNSSSKSAIDFMPRNSIESTIATHLESLALRAIDRCYRESPVQSEIDDFETVGDECFVLSTRHGSVLAITDKGGLYGLMLTTAADVYRINRFIKNFPWNHGMAEVGSKAYALYEKLGCDLDAVSGNMAKVSRCNKVGWDTVSVSERLIAQWAQETGLTMWRRTCKL